MNEYEWLSVLMSLAYYTNKKQIKEKERQAQLVIDGWREQRVSKSQNNTVDFKVSGGSSCRWAIDLQPLLCFLPGTVCRT